MEPNTYWSDYFTRFNNMEYFQNTNPTTNNYHAYMQPLQTNGDGVNSTSYWSQNYYTNWNCPPTTSTATASNNGTGVPVPSVQLNYIVNSNVVHNYGYGCMASIDLSTNPVTDPDTTFNASARNPAGK